MKRSNDAILFSAVDLNGFVQCRYSTFLDLKDLENPLKRAEGSEQAALIQTKGLEHERSYLEKLKDSNQHIEEIPVEGSLKDRAALTVAAMANGAPFIYQAALHVNDWHGYADLLKRVERPSNFGCYSYEVVDTKLSKSPKPDHIIQLGIYSDLLEKIQGVRPQHFSLILGQGNEENYRYEDFSRYISTQQSNFTDFVASPPSESRPEPCSFCSQCKWRDICKQKWETEDHLSLVANIRNAQVLKFEKAGIKTVRYLAELNKEDRVPLSQTAFQQLHRQARLQITKRDTGENQVELLSQVSGRGFERLPQPDKGDLFFDMEGDPLYPDGLEYLFGFYELTSGMPIFTPFWAHNHEEEKRAFQQVMDFVIRHFKKYPHAHIYHYNHYEETALKRLASQYGTREKELDDLLRGRKFVDLYKVVRESICVSEPGYSIKNLETFYMEKRGGDGVATAVDSIVVYEKWRDAKEDALLQQISAYNEDDCRSTHLLREWLLTLRIPGTTWFDASKQEEISDTQAKQIEEEQERVRIEEALLHGILENDRPFRELVAQLLEFHRREDKPKWWALFARQEKDFDELLEDSECLVSLEPDLDSPPFREKKSTVYSYRFPEQECKLREGDTFCSLSDLENLGKITALDVEACTVSLKTTQPELPKNLSITVQPSFNTKELKAAVKRFALSVSKGGGRYKALEAFLKRELPSLLGHQTGAPILAKEDLSVEAASKAVASLDKSYLFIQGPPGAGKTYTSSHIIVDLIRSGKRVAVSSNSHKAINNLLSAIVKVAQKKGVTIHGQKKGNKEQPESHFEGPMVRNFFDNKEIDTHANLVAGTAWLFAREEMDQEFDYLFIDEAGQVSLANLIAMGMSAKNLVLVGDQMQLGQPTQGSHPGSSGLSSLEYLLQGEPIISPERGIFLETTWRMHPNVCQLISEVVYDGKLHPEPNNKNRSLVLAEGAHPFLKANGVRFIPMDHEDCGQKSKEEGQVVKELYTSLMTQRYTDNKGEVHPITSHDVLVVTPYNAQVNYLKSILPHARIGTVDKFQGQEAEVVIVSMVTSGADDLPRDIEFLYSKNRLNVALSRARSLALIVANPKLLEIPCNTIEQMSLVNTLCWAREYAEGLSLVCL